MRSKTACLLGLGCLLIALKGDSCLVEDRTVDVVVTGDIPAIWHTGGLNSAGADTELVNAASYVQDALDNLSGDSEIDSIRVSGVCYEVLSNNGFVGAHAGDVTIDGHPLLHFAVPSNATGVTGSSEGAEVTLVAEGVSYVNTKLAAYLAGNPAALNNLLFRATWTSTPPGTTPYDFDWKTCLVLQILGHVTLQVPNP